MKFATNTHPTSAPNSQMLMARIANHDEAALAELYDRFGALAYAVAMRVTQDHAVTEEVVQDTFHAVWRTASAFDPGDSVVAWICTIARHRAIDATRTRVFRARTHEQSISPALKLATDEQIDEQVERLLTSGLVLDAMRQIHPAQREVLTLAYFGGLSHAEIAAHTGAPLGTVKARQRLGLIQLRRHLALVQW